MPKKILPILQPGDVYGLRVVLCYADRDRWGSPRVRVCCIQNKEHVAIVRACDLLRGKARQCESCRSTTHGLSQTTEYATAHDAIRRCEDEEHAHYRDYGARGIKIWSGWSGTSTGERAAAMARWLIENLGQRPEGLVLDRIDNNRDYVPGNLRWATYTTSNNNYGHNHRIAWRGEELTLAAWSRRTGIGSELLRWRLTSGWSHDDAFTTPPRQMRTRPRRRVA